jgi:hypothetical protein
MERMTAVTRDMSHKILRVIDRGRFKHFSRGTREESELVHMLFDNLIKDDMFTFSIIFNLRNNLVRTSIVR